jgi:hypothetical protein
MTMSSWRLDPALRFAVYLAVAALFATGVGWLLADQMKESAGAEIWQQESAAAEIWQQASAMFLMLHGGVAMLALMLLGALVPLHIVRAWSARKNLGTGILMLACNGGLVVTAFALYYLGAEAIRPWASALHIAFGLGLPLALVLHIKIGRARRPAGSAASRRLSNPLPASGSWPPLT